jgi:hypothetical protein
MVSRAVARFITWYAKPPGHRLGFRDMDYTLPSSPPHVKWFPTLFHGRFFMAPGFDNYF